jgi:hypothetical protein
MEKNKIQNKQSFIKSIKSDCVPVVEINVEEFYVPEDVLDEASAAKYQMVPTKSKLRHQKELEIFTQWQTEKRIKGKDEHLMAYFKNTSIEAVSARS